MDMIKSLIGWYKGLYKYKWCIKVAYCPLFERTEYRIYERKNWYLGWIFVDYRVNKESADKLIIKLKEISEL